MNLNENGHAWLTAARVQLLLDSIITEMLSSTKDLDEPQLDYPFLRPVWSYMRWSEREIGCCLPGIGPIALLSLAIWRILFRRELDQRDKRIYVHVLYMEY